MKKTYKTLESSRKTLEILRFLGNSPTPVYCNDIAEAMMLNYNTAMCHLYTLESEGYIENTGNGYIVTSNIAIFWKNRRDYLKKIQAKVDEESELLELDD